MENSPNVSIIITTYNRDKYIKETLDSVIKQTYKDFEVLIIDDGSTDKTSDIVNSYNDERIKYIYKENAGQNTARNKGLELSQGKYIAFLDSDDIWLPEKLAKQVYILENFSNIDIVYGGSLLIDENNKILGSQPLITYSGNVIDKLIFKNFLYNGSIALFRKKCLAKTGIFDCSINRMTDWEFYLRLALYWNFYGIDEYLIKYRIHPETMSFNFRDYEKCGFEILEKIFSHKDFPAKYLNYQKMAYAFRYKYLARRCCENNCKKEALKYLLKSIIQAPSILSNKDVISIFLNSITNLKKLKKILFFNISPEKN